MNAIGISFQAHLSHHDPAVVAVFHRLEAAGQSPHLEQLYELIYSRLDTSLRSGIDMTGFANLARLTGFNAHTGETTSAALAADPTPAYTVISDPKPRFVVVCGGDSSGLIILDPKRGRDYLENAFFEAAWSGSVTRLHAGEDLPQRYLAAVAGLDGETARIIADLKTRYRAVFIEKGGHGFIYKGRRGTSPVCIKIIPQFYSSRKYRVAFLNEFEIYRRLESQHHPGLIQLYQMDLDNRYLVMEAAEESLAEQDLPVPLETALLWFTQIVDAVNFLHERNFIHRDIKPGNLLLFVGGRIKLADFGLALNLEKGRSYFQPDRQGTPLYMAPEQKQGEPLGKPTDIYALGLVLLELLVGRSSQDKRFRQTPTLAMRKLNLPNSISHMIRDCLVRDPSRRPSALALKNRVQALSTKPRLRSLIAAVPGSRRPVGQKVSRGGFVSSLSLEQNTGPASPSRQLGQDRSVITDQSASI